MTTDYHGFGQFAPSDCHIESGYVRIFGGLWIEPPDNPAADCLTHDVVIDNTASVTVEVNGRPVPQVVWIDE